MMQGGAGDVYLRTFDASDAAEAWKRGAAARALWLGPATDLMLDLAGIGPGSRVLDVAAGTGEQALAAARRAGPDGYVLATDISDAMLQVAAAMAREMGLENFETRTADAQDLKLEPESFDAAICRLGLMFIPDLARGLAEIRRALRPGGKLAAMVWASPEKTQLFAIPNSAVRQRRQAAGLPTRAPGPVLGDPDVLTSALQTAGFASVTVHPVSHTRRFSSAAEAVKMVMEEFPMQRAQAADLNEIDRAAAFGEIETGYRRFSGPDGIEIPGEVLLAMGTR